jgi:hypothetical protein
VTSIKKPWDMTTEELLGLTEEQIAQLKREAEEEYQRLLDDPETLVISPTIYIRKLREFVEKQNQDKSHMTVVK